MKRLIIFLLTVLLASPFAGAQLWKQKRYEAMAAIGTSQFYGDVGGFTIGENAVGLRDISLLQTRFNVSASFRYFIIDEVAARVSLTYAMLHATDERGSNEQRGLESTTSIFEPAVIGEYYITRFKQRNSYGFLTGRGVSRGFFEDFFKSLDVYVLTGIGGLNYYVNPNDELDARDMRTKGFSAVIPLGIGAKMVINTDILLGVELCGRFALTDYVDGYTSQYSARNDVYHTFSFTFNYRIKTARNGLPSFR